ncbi:unnamed protein product [Fusarium fujikuroi]|nr:unnamed protein product [Fusarium fujikuroi]VZH89721.1 unnamed protein product [Fusarium fujikuroi]
MKFVTPAAGSPGVKDILGLKEDNILLSVRAISHKSADKVIKLIAREGIKQYKEVLRAASNKIRQYVNRAVKERKEEKQGISKDRKVANIKVNTIYKRKGVKIYPIDNTPLDSSILDSDPFWKEKKWAEIKDILDIAAKLSALKDQDFLECRQLDLIVAPLQVLKQARDILIPKGYKAAVIRLLKERLTHKVLEKSHNAYQNAWFLVAKKDGNFCLINFATLMNKVTVRDGLLPPHADKFSADFAICKIILLLDFFLGYN